MTTVDHLLTRIIHNPRLSEETLLSSRDVNVLQSLANNITSPIYITENQSRLLLKIFRDNLKKLEKIEPEISTYLSNPVWTKPFRIIEQVRKVFIGEKLSGEKQIVLEFTFSSQIRKILANLNKKLTGLTQHSSGKIYYVDLTEKNIVTLMEELKDSEFEFDEDLKNYYNTIKSWSRDQVLGQFFITTITNNNFHKHITEDLGISTPIDNNIIQDRSMRYQFFTENVKKTPQTLTEKIAYRENSKIWINKAETSLEEVFASLTELKRFPVLVVFDSYDPKTCLEDLTKLSNSLECADITSDVGIYFRLDNTDIGKQFNQLIAEKQYNGELNSDTKIVGVQNGKIPKFFLKNDWRPMSVISINNSLKHSKTAIYANCCDLIITYTDKEPIFENRVLWE